MENGVAMVFDETETEKLNSYILLHKLMIENVVTTGPRLRYMFTTSAINGVVYVATSTANDSVMPNK